MSWEKADGRFPTGRDSERWKIKVVRTPRVRKFDVFDIFQKTAPGWRLFQRCRVVGVRGRVTSLSRRVSGKGCRRMGSPWTQLPWEGASRGRQEMVSIMNLEVADYMHSFKTIRAQESFTRYDYHCESD